jgi:phosphoglycolate phosphatase-like HAD superfamily hydrolase
MTLYVGDSAEDIMMANSAKKSSTNILFAGITGLKENPKSAEKFFMEYSADLIVKSVDDLADLYTKRIYGDGK